MILLFAGCTSRVIDTVNAIDTSNAIDKSNGIDTLNATNTHNTIDTSSKNLSNWLGNYEFTEYAEPDVDMEYKINISKKDGKYLASIYIDGFQTVLRIQANIVGNSSSIKFIFEKYLPDNLFEVFSKGDTLLEFKQRNSSVYTYWGEIQPAVLKNQKTGKEYFKIVTEFETN